MPEDTVEYEHTDEDGEILRLRALQLPGCPMAVIECSFMRSSRAVIVGAAELRKLAVAALALADTLDEG